MHYQCIAPTLPDKKKSPVLRYVNLGYVKEGQAV